MKLNTKSLSIVLLFPKAVPPSSSSLNFLRAGRIKDKQEFHILCVFLWGMASRVLRIYILEPQFQCRFLTPMLSSQGGGF